MSLCRRQDKRPGRYHLIGAEEEDPVVIERVRWLVVAIGVARGTPGGLAVAEIARLDYAVTRTPILPATGWRLVRLDHPVVYVGEPLPERYRPWPATERAALQIDIAGIPRLQFVSAHTTLQILSELRSHGHSFEPGPEPIPQVDGTSPWHTIPSRAAGADEFYQTARRERSNIAPGGLLRNTPRFHEFGGSDARTLLQRVQKPGLAIGGRRSREPACDSSITVIITVTNTVMITVMITVIRRSSNVMRLPRPSGRRNPAGGRCPRKRGSNVATPRCRKDCAENGIGFLDENDEMRATWPVGAGKPVLDRALGGAGPAHEDLGRPMRLTEVGDERVRDDLREGGACTITVNPARKLLARFRQHLSAPPPLHCRAEERWSG